MCSICNVYTICFYALHSLKDIHSIQRGIDTEFLPPSPSEIPGSPHIKVCTIKSKSAYPYTCMRIIRYWKVSRYTCHNTCFTFTFRDNLFQHVTIHISQFFLPTLIIRFIPYWRPLRHLRYIILEAFIHILNVAVN